MAEEPHVSQEAQGSYIAQATHGGTATVTVYTSPPSLSDQNRARFLVRLRTRYRDLLEQSLQGAMRMQLQLAGHPDAVTPPAQLLYQSAKPPNHLLHAEISLTKIYENAGHELLVLGEPGAGKSTQLLELASDLVDQAQRDPRLLLPVIVPLSSWSSKRAPLEQWLGEQVALLYDIALPLSRRWIQDERLLLLLDGLDEMEEGARVACIGAINTYHRAHLHPLVVASRRAEYEVAALAERLSLNSAVVIQPLTVAQVDDYLQQNGEAVAALRATLRESAGLQEIATTPLMLSILILAYQSKGVSALPVTVSLPELQRQIFAAYVQRMMARKEKLIRYSPQDLVCWLRWLAQQMRKRNQTIFYLEHLQLGWLTPMLQCRYEWWAIRLPALLIGMLASLTIAPLLDSVYPVFLLHYTALGGSLGWLLSKSTSGSSALPKQPASSLRRERLHRFGDGISASIVMGLIIGLSWGLQLGEDGYGLGDWLRDGSISGIVIGLSILLLSVLLPSFPSDLVASIPHATQHRCVLTHLSQTIHGRRAWLGFAILGTGFGLSNGLSSWLGYGLRFGLSDGLMYGLSYGLSAGFISVLVSLILSEQAEGITLIEHLRWTWRSLVRSLFTLKHAKEAFLVTSLVGLSYGLNDGLLNGQSNTLTTAVIMAVGTGLSLGPSFGLLYWLLLGLFQGIESAQIEDRARLLPNQGIRRSLYNSMLLALISSILISVIGVLSLTLNAWLNSELIGRLTVWQFGGVSGVQNLGLIDWLTGLLRYELNFELNVWLIPAVCGGLLVFTSRGGLAVLRHYVIRLLLSRSHTFPWHAPGFLEEATAHILLRRVGGGYSFPHRLLLDYFADLPQETL